MKRPWFTGVSHIRRLLVASDSDRWVTRIGPDIAKPTKFHSESVHCADSIRARGLWGAIPSTGKTNVLPVLERAGFGVRSVMAGARP
jgi:hypothetical protein